MVRVKRKSYNTGKWSKELPFDSILFEKYESIPYNPRMADVFYMSGEIESWGIGFLKIKREGIRFDNQETGISSDEEMILVDEISVIHKIAYENMQKICSEQLVD